MPLNNTSICYYDHNVLRLPQDKRQEYNGQVDRLIANLTARLHEKTEFKISRVVKAGSFAKHTILRQAPGYKPDVDVVFYLKDRDVTKETYEQLGQEILNFLIASYPTKSVEDFTIQKRAATVSFVGTGLNVDIVPVIEIPDSGGQGWQYGTDGTRVQTCAPCQLSFIAVRKQKDPKFRTLVRLAKHWRCYHDVPGLKSYAIELITAYLLDRDGIGGTVEERFRRFLLYLAQSKLKETISFAENQLPLGTFTEPVVVIDPVNSSNNVAARITEAERLAIVSAACETWETAHYASQQDNLDAWKEVFGPRFKIEDAEGGSA